MKDDPGIITLTLALTFLAAGTLALGLSIAWAIDALAFAIGQAIGHLIH